MGAEATPAFYPAWPALPAVLNSQPQAPMGRAAESQFLRIKVGLHALRGPCQHHRGPATLQAPSVPEAAWLKLSSPLNNERFSILKPSPLGPSAPRQFQDRL